MKVRKKKMVVSTNQVKEDIIRLSKMLDKKEDYISFLTFVSEIDIKYTENDNGVFINLNLPGKKTLIKIHDKLSDIITPKKTE